jgi:hypothetical protein
MTKTVEFLGLLTLLARPGTSGGAAGPNPTPLASLISPDKVGEYRRLRCRFYDRCLDAALLRNWCSWSCRACALEAPCADPALDIDHAALLRPRAGQAEGLGRRPRAPSASSRRSREPRGAGSGAA